MSGKRLATIVGARPQFVKAVCVSAAFASRGQSEFVIHTGQHYDRQMSDVFFEQLGLAHPSVMLNVGSASHGVQTGKMLIDIEKCLLENHCESVLVYGDTNSTLAGALAAAKLNIPVIHIEAGLRSYNREMPEEVNRVVTDHCSKLLLCPTEQAKLNLEKEGIRDGVFVIGDVMFDAVLKFGQIAAATSNVLKTYGLNQREFVLATLHRPSNTDNRERLAAILEAFGALYRPVLLPVHPRTQQAIDHLVAAGLKIANNVLMCPPLSYFDMLAAEQFAKAIVTDSGGVQKEAFMFHVPCVTLRTETEWTETVKYGWNVLLGADFRLLREIVERPTPPPPPDGIYGDGRASERIADIIAGTN